VDEHGALTPDDAYESYYVPETGDPEDTSALVSLIEDALYMDWIDSMVAGETVSRRSSEAIHMDAYRRSLAALALLQSHDHVTNNFHFSLQAQPESAPAWEFYMEDLDLSFGCLWNSSQRSSFCEEVSWDGWWFEGVYSLDQDEAADFELGRTPYWGNLAIHFALMEASSREAYEALLCEFLGSRFWRSRLPGIVRGLAAHIEEDVRTDPQDRYGEIDDWRAAVDDLQHFIEARGDYLEGAVPCP
jgi:hypothetical protein